MLRLRLTLTVQKPHPATIELSQGKCEKEKGEKKTSRGADITLREENILRTELGGVRAEEEKKTLRDRRREECQRNRK